MKTKIIGIAVGIAIALSACKKDTSKEQPEIPDNLGVRKIQTWFQNQNNSITGRAIHLPKLEDAREGVLQWNKTAFYSSSNSYSTPVEIGDMDINVPGKVHKFLFTQQNATGVITGGVYYYVVSDNKKTLTTFTGMPPADFTGTIFKYDIGYNLISSQNYKDGLGTNEAHKLVMKQNDKVYEASSLVPLACGECIEWWDVTYNPETGVIISEVYVYTECGDCPEEGGTGGTGGTGGSTGGGGNNGGTIISWEPDDEYTCPANFSFVSVTTNNLWQEAELTNIYCNVVYLNGSGSHAVMVNIPQLYFGLPYYNVNGQLVYSQNTAKAISADALNMAEYDMREYFKTHTTMTAGQLQQYWVQRANIRMMELTQNKGRTSRYGSESPANPVPAIPYSACY